ncbi:MAG: PKD domain-containing protein [Bacteroidales bacterium]|jgi:hypothetical protein|nr:PKD domain-containing protein [Bacteroidales bacterium]
MKTKNYRFSIHFIVLMVSMVNLSFFNQGLVMSQNALFYTNYLCDSSFEQSTNYGGFPDSGCYQDALWGDANAVLDGGPAHPNHVRTGANSLHIYTGVPDAIYISQPNHVPVSVIAGQSYNASVYYKFPPEPNFNWVPGSKVFLRLIFLNQTGIEINHFDSPYLDKPTDWTKAEVIATAPPNSFTAKVVMRLEKPQVMGRSVINADDCSLTQTEIPPIIDVEPKNVSCGAFNDTVFLRIGNEGGGNLSFNILTPQVPWLNILPLSGNILSGGKQYITAILNRANLPTSPCNQLFTLIQILSSGNTDTITIPVVVNTPCGVPDSGSIVNVTGSQLMVRKRLPCNKLTPSKPYIIKGFCWSPASIETDSNCASRRQAIDRWAAYDMGMIKGAQSNTVYTFLDFGLNMNSYKKILDAFYENGIMAIITVDLDGSFDTANLRSVVSAYKNHPAILMWALGNEWNINFYHKHFSTVEQAAAGTEIAAQLIKSIDTLHPVASIYGDISIAFQSPDTYTIVNSICPSIDVWGLNIYRGFEFYDLFTQWAGITGKPMFMSEFGIDSFHTIQWDPAPPIGSINETEQKDWNESLWNDLRPELSGVNPAKQCLGGTYFEWNDEYWKAKPAGIQNTGGFYTDWNPSAFPDSYANEDFFGIVRIDSNIRIPKKSYDQIAIDFHDTLVAQFIACDTVYGLCNTQGICFYDLSSGTPTSWLWEFGDGESSILPNPSHIYQNPGFYTVSLTVSEGVLTSTAAKSNFIHCIPCQIPLSGINIENNQTNCYNATQTITVAGNNTTFTIQDGGSATMIAGQKINYLPGTRVYSGGYMSGYITTTDQYCGVSGLLPKVNETSNTNTEKPTIGSHVFQSFKVFPNPTTGNFILELPGEIESMQYHVEVYGMRGDKVLSEVLNGERRHEFLISDRPMGVYFIRVISENTTETAKIIKQ